MVAKRFIVPLALGGLLGAGVVGGFAPLVRLQAARTAERYGGSVAIERVVPTLGGVQLRGVDVALAEVPSVKVHFDEVAVQYSTRGRAIALRGGVVQAVGPREVVQREVEAYRARHRPQADDGAGKAGGPGRALDLEALTLAWRNDAHVPTETLTASGVTFAREEDRVAVTAAEAAYSQGLGRVAVKNGRVVLERDEAGYKLAELTTDGLDAEVTIPPKSEPPPPDVELARDHSDPKAAQGLGDALRTMMLKAAGRVDGVVKPLATIRLAGLSARVHRGPETLNLGPGILKVGRSGTRLVVELAPELRVAPERPGEEQTLTFRLSIPLLKGPDEEVVADVQGGPIWLSTLGIKDGDFGLFDVARTSLTTRSHVAFSGDGARVALDGEGKLHHLSVRSAALSDEPVEGLELAWKGKGEVLLDGSRVKIEHAEVDLGAIQVQGRGTFERVSGATDPKGRPPSLRESAEGSARPRDVPPAPPGAAASAGDGFHVSGAFEVPITACQSMLDSTPRGLIPRLQGMRMAGSFALKGTADVDTTHLDRGYHIDWDTSNTCRIAEAPASISLGHFRAPFKQKVYASDGEPTEIEAGPGTLGWVPFSGISKFMAVAVETTEDASFERHHGFDAEAIRNSIRENLRRRRFVRGASTISMQLAKNLYLDRTKNLSRKLQEAVLTMYLEQELTKEQILELYLNAVEFGPLVYGIGPAAHFYFNTSAADLSLGQALYLSSIMPNPKVQRFGPGGVVSNGWMSYLHKLMRIAHKRNHLTDEELDLGLRETVVRGSPTPRLAPRDAARDPAGGMPEPPGDVEWTE